MTPEVSVILICYNKYPQNLVTLNSLKNQNNFDVSRLEVIMVDDASTDNTIRLKNYRTPYQFKYIRNEKTLGRAGAKNIGIANAEGKVVIFLDGEMIVDTNFIAYHLRHYKEDENIVVSGTSGNYAVYSTLYPDFTSEQIKKFYQQIKYSSFYRKKLKLTSESHKLNLRKLLEYKNRLKKPMLLLSKPAINKEIYKKVAEGFPSFPGIVKKFGPELQGYYLPWTFFITRNVSVSKKLLEQVKGFNEDFQGWGYEDWELGYRLYKHGVKFIEDPTILNYHQEHPYSKVDRKKEQMSNYSLFVTLHPEIEVCAFSLNFLEKKISLFEINDIIADYYLLNRTYPNEYQTFKTVLIYLLQKIPFLLSEGENVSDLLNKIDIKQKERQQFVSDEKKIKQTTAFPHLSNAFELITTL